MNNPGKTEDNKHRPTRVKEESSMGKNKKNKQQSVTDKNAGGKESCG